MGTVTLRNTPLSQRLIDAVWGSIDWASNWGFADYAGTEAPIADLWKAGGIDGWRYSHGWGSGSPETGRNSRRIDQFVSGVIFAHYDLSGPATDASSYVLKAGSRPPVVNTCLATITAGTPPSGSQTAYGTNGDPVSHLNAVRFIADPSYRLLANVQTASGVQVPENILMAMPAIRVAQIEIGNEPGGHEGFQNFSTTSSGSNVFPGTTLNVNATTGSPTAPSSVKYGSSVFNYTGKSATQFTGVTTTFTGTIPSGSVIKRDNTQTTWINNFKWYCSHYYYYWKVLYEAIEAGWGSWWPTSWGWPRFQGFTNVEANTMNYTDAFLAEYFPLQAAGVHQLNEHHLPFWLESTPNTTAGTAGGGNPDNLASGAAGSGVRILDILDARLKPDGSPETNANVVKGMVGYHRYGGPKTNTDEAIAYVGTSTADEGQTPVGANNQLAHGGKIDSIRAILDGKGATGVGIVCNEGQHNVSFKGDQTVDGRASYTYLLDIILNLNRWDLTGQMYQYHMTGCEPPGWPTNTFRRGWGASDFTLHTVGMVIRDLVAPIGTVPLLAEIGTRGVSVTDRIACAWTKAPDGLTADVLAVNLDLPISATAGPASASHSHTWNVPQALTGNIVRTSLLRSAGTPVAPTVANIASGGASSFTDTLQIGELVRYKVTFATALPGGGGDSPPPPASFAFTGRFAVARRATVKPPGLDGRRALPRPLGLLNIAESTQWDTVVPGTGGQTLRDVSWDTLIGGVQLRDRPLLRAPLPPPPGDP